jgi:hypothetical protein
MVDRSMKVVARGVEVAEHVDTTVAALEPMAKRQWVAEPAPVGSSGPEEEEGWRGAGGGGGHRHLAPLPGLP